LFRIKELREQTGLTQEKFASKIGISRIYLCQLENGHKLNPSIALLKRIAQALDTNIISLIAESEFRVRDG